MKISAVEEARMKLASLVVFRGILDDPVIKAFRAALDSDDLPLFKQVDLYCEFASRLLGKGGNWSRYLLDRILCDDNRYVRDLACENAIPPSLEMMAERELKALEAVGQVTFAQVAEKIGVDFPLAGWETVSLNYTGAFHERAARLSCVGYGMFAEYFIFLLGDSGLIPVPNPDPVIPEVLTGYERERETVAANTLALLEGKPAANVLLYGDSGTGKSTCVKAVANSMWDKGLRLIELRRDQLNKIPMLIDMLHGNPLKFILFIDDLSFANNSDNFSSLKAVLEGSVSAKTSNMVIYATSNRRHLIRETFSGREGDEIHLRDTIEELSSLSDRFGLHVTFLRPDRELYLGIAERYCEQFSIAFDEKTRKQAEAFALSRGGRSARTAKQFAESLASAASDL